MPLPSLPAIPLIIHRLPLIFPEGTENRNYVTRKIALTSLAIEAGFGEGHLSFLTAFMDRSSAPFKKSIAELAWGSYAWCASEPEHIIDLREGVPRKLSDAAFRGE